MFIFRKKPRVYSAHRSCSSIMRKKRATAVFLFIEPILFYMLVAAVLIVSAYVLLEKNDMTAVYSMAFIVGVILPGIITISSWQKKKEQCKRVYVEHMTYLFCKCKDFKKALFEIRDVFPKKEESSVINMALFTMQKTGKTECAMQYIEQRFGGRVVRLLHRYILESLKRPNYVPPAEILTYITTSPTMNERPSKSKRKDRWTIFLCALISMSICMVIEVLGKETGFLSKDYESFSSRFFAFVIFSLVFIIYELKELLQKEDWNNSAAFKVSSYLKELTFFLLVMPVPSAIKKSVEFSEWSIKKKVSKLAVAIEKNNTAEIYLNFAEQFQNETIKRVMEFLYAKSQEPYLAPAELTAMLRKLDEIMAKEISRTIYEKTRERTSLLLAPQLATFVMLFGNILSLANLVGRKI